MLESFAMPPADSRPFWVLAPAVLLLIGVLGLLVATLVGSQRTRFEVSDAGLRIRGDIYGRLIRPIGCAAERPASQPQDGRAISAGQTPDWDGRARLPRRLVSPAERGALVYLTAPDSVVYVPTREGYSLLLSVENPARFVRAMQRVAQLFARGCLLRAIAGTSCCANWR